MIQSSTVQITPEILGLIAGSGESKGAWRALGVLVPPDRHELQQGGGYPRSPGL